MEPHRIIFSLQVDLAPAPGSPAGASSAIVLPVNREGMSVGRNGKARPPTTRTIDLRVGDDVMVDQRWRRCWESARIGKRTRRQSRPRRLLLAT